MNDDSRKKESGMIKINGRLISKFDQLGNEKSFHFSSKFEMNFICDKNSSKDEEKALSNFEKLVSRSEIKAIYSLKSGKIVIDWEKYKVQLRNSNIEFYQDNYLDRFLLLVGVFTKDHMGYILRRAGMVFETPNIHMLFSSEEDAREYAEVFGFEGYGKYEELGGIC